MSVVYFVSKLTVIFSPTFLFANYYVNACIAHNIYLTYYDYHKSYDKRIIFYKYSIIALSILVFIITLFHLDNPKFYDNVIYNLMLYDSKFINVFYIVALLMIAFIIHRMYFILIKDNELITLDTDDARESAVKTLTSELVKFHMIRLFLFLIINVPNNILAVTNLIFNDNSIRQDYDKSPWLYISVFFISLSGTISVVTQLLDPYQRRIVKSFFSRNTSQDQFHHVKTLGDLKEMLGDFRGSIMNIQAGSDEVKRGSWYYPPIEMSQIHLSTPENTTPTNQHSDFNNTSITINRTSKSKLSSSDDKDSIIFSCHLHNNNLNTPSFTRLIPKRSDNISNISNLSDNSSVPRKSQISDINSNNILNTNLNNSVSISSHPNNPNLTFNHNNIKRNPLCTSQTSFTPFNKSFRKKTNHIINNLSEDRTYDLINYHLELTDNICRMIGITISINQDRVYEKGHFFKSKFDMPLPWTEINYYEEKSNTEEYKQETLPDWVSIKYEKRFKYLKLKLKKYASLVFHHIRVIDGISIDDCIKSLDPILNLDKVNELKVSGGRSPNSILYTWDRKMLIKTISKQEKDLFFNEVLQKYHARMRDTKSLLCRIYGLFKISISDQFSTYVVLMKNMCELPLDTKVLAFDLKGSTVDRDCISAYDKKNYLKEELIKEYKNKTLKDNDLKYLDFKLNLSSSDATNLITAVEKDSYFLEKYWITDYSLLLAIHQFKVEDYRNNFKNLRVLKSADDKYLFSTYDLEKKGEKFTKNIASIMKMAKDNNFSCQDPKRYGLRYRTYIKGLIKVEDY